MDKGQVYPYVEKSYELLQSKGSPARVKKVEHSSTGSSVGEKEYVSKCKGQVLEDGDR